MATLNPCPHCKQRKFAFVNDEDGWIFCRNCGYSTKVFDTIHEAIEAWNNATDGLEDSCRERQPDRDQRGSSPQPGKP